ncbi:MAG: hypothetical protein RL375_3495 [Pseudomonadota bacterium]|jgi:hypothetical protein
MATYCINFKREFADAVQAGTKLQTIRGHRKDGKRIKPGDTLKLYTGLRTTGARLLRQVPCAVALSIRMDLPCDEVVIDGTKLDFEQRSAFAQADGFAGWIEMRRWFWDQYGLNEFEGFLVGWAP